MDSSSSGEVCAPRETFDSVGEALVSGDDGRVFELPKGENQLHGIVDA